MYDAQRVQDLLAQAKPGHTLPQPFYRDADVYEFDVAAVLRHSWLMLGFEAELPEAGSFVSTDIGPHSIILVRGSDAQIRGFHNTCRHRGSRICTDPSGRTSRLVCPYHKWTYALDGSLLAAPRMPPGLVFEENGLMPIHIELLQGCIYGSLSVQAPPFTAFRAAAEPFLRPYGLANAKLAYQCTLIEKANWKLVMENARECYHCASAHPELKVSFPVLFGSGLAVMDAARHGQYVQRMRALEIPVGPISGEWWHIGRYPLNDGVQSVSPTGHTVVARELFHQDEPIGGLRWATEPNSFCHAFTDYAFSFTALPIGPEETCVVAKWLVHRDAHQDVDYSLEALTQVWTKTNLQDRNLAENNQRGVNGSGYRPGPYAKGAEDLVIRFNDWYRATASRAVGLREAAREARPPS